MSSRNDKRLHRKRRINVKVRGTQERPRLCVYKSLTAIYAQLINDEKGETIVTVDSRKVKAKTPLEKSKEVGKMIAQKGKEKGISSIVFDRGGYNYHGKVKALAEGAREGGLEF